MTQAATLDLRGLSCPIPLMRLRRHLRSARAGERVVVLTSDPQAKPDFQSFCDGRASRIIDLEESHGYCKILIEKC